MKERKMKYQWAEYENIHWKGDRYIAMGTFLFVMGVLISYMIG